MVPSIGIGFATDGVAYGHVDDAQVEPERPVLHIPDVLTDAVFHLIEFLGLATATVHLCPTGNARLQQMAHHVFVYQCRIFLGMLEHMRTRTDYRHVSQEYIDELRQLIDAALAEEIAKPRLAGVILGRLEPSASLLTFMLRNL